VWEGGIDVPRRSLEVQAIPVGVLDERTALQPRTLGAATSPGTAEE
jgi:hypothetical protein